MTSHNNINNGNKATVPLLYSIMGVSPSIGARELRKHYHALSLQFHPDRHHSRDSQINNISNSCSNAPCNLSDRFHDITAAYHILSDPVKRAAYDTRHGVNFNSRVSNVHEQITRHNTNTANRSVQSECKNIEIEEEKEQEEQEYMVEESVHEQQEIKQNTRKDDKDNISVHNIRNCSNTYEVETDHPCTNINNKSDNENDDDDDDEDEEYMPEENASSMLRRRNCPFVLLPITASSPSLTHSERYFPQSSDVFHEHVALKCNINNDNIEDYNNNRNDGKSCNKSFKPKTEEHYYCSPEPQQHHHHHHHHHHCLKTVTITRETAMEPWGLVFSRNNVLQCCSTHPGVPFPSIVLEINDQRIHATDDVCEVIERLTRQTKEHMCSKESKRLHNNSYNNEIRDNNQCTCTMNIESQLNIYTGNDNDDDKDVAAKDAFSLNTKHDLTELHMLLTYNVEVYELRGDIDALICINTETDLYSRKTALECEEKTISDFTVNYKVLDELIPHNQVVSELPSLLPGHCVLRVNSTNVNNALELRSALISAAEEIYTSSQLTNANVRCKESANENDNIAMTNSVEYSNANVASRLRSFSVKVEVASVNPC